MPKLAFYMILFFMYFRTIFTFLATTVIVGQSSSFAPDYAKAKIAAQRVFDMINSVPSIDNQSEDGMKPVRTTRQEVLFITKSIALS